MRTDQLGSEGWDAESIVSGLDVNYRIEGDIRKKVRSVSAIDRATKNDLSFCSSDGEKGAKLISQSKAGIILCKKNMEGLVRPKPDAQLVFVDNPRLVFVHFMNRIYKKKQMSWISPRAVISKTANIGTGCYIGDYTVIGDSCKIGDNTVIYDRVSLVQNCVIGRNCVIQSGVTMGADGFAFERHENGELERFPHMGRVIIGDNVEIFANSNIVRGSLSDTVIGDGTKIDALVHIAHNAIIGKNCMIIAGSVVGGSTKIGDSTWIGINASLKNKIKIGNNVIVAAGACVINDVPDEDIVAGIPAKSIKDKVNMSSYDLFWMAGQKKSSTEKR